MKAVPVRIDWRDDMSIYASEKFLRLVGDEYGWLAGVAGDGRLRCVLPYTVVRKASFRLLRFRIETIAMDEGLSVEEERSFLNDAVAYFRARGIDMIIPATTSTIFRTYPDGAIAAPYASYVLDLEQSEEALWENIHATYRKNIRQAKKGGVSIYSGTDRLETAYGLIRDTFRRSSLGFMGYDAFERQVAGLGENVRVLIAYHQGKAQSCTVFPFSRYGAYAVYGGSVPKPAAGAMKLVQWEAIRRFRQLGVRRFDFVGARVDPERGSKQEGIMLFKKYLGGKPVQGYIWKYPLRRVPYLLYSLATRLQRGGDIVDSERHKLAAYGGESCATPG